MTLITYTYSESHTTLKLFAPTPGYTWTHECELPISLTPLIDDGLTKFFMKASEKSLANEWDNEDDVYWASYLKG